MSQLKLTADGGGGTVAIKAPASTTGNAAIELTVPGTGNATLLTSEASTGKILQVVSTTKTDTFSESSIDEGEHSGAAISVTITPSATSSKIFIMASLSVGLNNDNEVSFAFFKGGSILTGAIGDAASSRLRTGFVGKCEGTSAMEGLTGFYLDTPSYSLGDTLTYDCRLSHGANGGNRTMYLNRSSTDTNADQDSRAVSTITVVEVAA